MKHAKWISALMLLFVPLIAAAQLGQSGRIVTQVPFKFMVADVAIPAGEVTVQLANENARVLIVSNRDAKVATFARPLPAESRNTVQVGAMVFHKYGDSYFLAGLKIADSRIVYQFRQSKLEKELIAQNLRPTEEILLASTR
jgi:hypothetical protein